MTPVRQKYQENGVVWEADALAEAMTEVVGPDERPVLIDFDHTLFASNSTELFLSSARPAFLVSIILGLMHAARFLGVTIRLGNFRLRDYLTVFIVIALMPWSYFAWRKRGPELFSQHASHPLAESLARLDSKRMIVVSFGIAPLIRALLRGSPWGDCTIVGAEFPCKFRDLYRGKASMVRDALPRLAVEQAVFITVSDDDSDLLAIVADSSF